MNKLFEVKDKVAKKISDLGKTPYIYLYNGVYKEDRQPLKEDEIREIVKNAGGKLIAINGHLVEDVNK